MLGLDSKPLSSQTKQPVPQMPVRARVETAEFFNAQRKQLVERNRGSQLQKNLGSVCLPQPSFARFSS